MNGPLFNHPCPLLPPACLPQNPKKAKRPSTLVFSRQGMPNMNTTSIEACQKGAYVVHGAEHETPDVIIIGE
jgi:transketolase